LVETTGLEPVTSCV